MYRFAQDVLGPMNVPMFFVSTGTNKDSGGYFSSLLADRTCLTRIGLFYFFQTNPVLRQFVGEILLDFPERPIRELLRLFLVDPFFLSGVSLHSLHFSNVHVRYRLRKAPVDKLLRCFMKRIPQLSL